MFHDFDTSILNHVAHRPWPMPDGPWVMTQTWHDLLFAHWPVDEQALRRLVPPAFELDRCDGSPWVGIVPFRMTNVGPRGLPRLPWVSAFPELNVRTYVRVADRPGVYFFSLDAGSAIAVRAARLLLNLPYFSAAIRITPRGDALEYASQRKDTEQAAQLHVAYRPAGSERLPSPGSLEHFLTERYCLYHLDHRGAPYRLEIHHPPWQLQRAEATFGTNTMTQASGFLLPPSAPILHFSRRQDMVAWPPVAIDTSRADHESTAAAPGKTGA